MKGSRKFDHTIDNYISRFPYIPHVDEAKLIASMTKDFELKKKL